MSFRKLVLIFSLLTTVTVFARAQDDSIPLPTIIQKTEQYTQNFPSEKVYVHFDKPYYAVGDTIWFKAYVTLPQHQLSGVSKIVYLDLINNRDSIVAALRIPVVNGSASSSIVLSQEAYIEGNYHVRAYTNWMRNFDNAYFFTKNITIGNTVDKNNPIDTHISFVNSVNLTTEKINAKIVYKDPDGAPYLNRKVSWKVQDDNDETIDKGKGTTDQNGVLDISFSSSKPGAFASAVLTSEIEINYKKTITNTFSLKTAYKAHGPLPIKLQAHGDDSKPISFRNIWVREL